uniref:Uncharacterized protein n=1 Tax=Arundo donax TaxID=35708 RepID=A0A0A9AB46_ARUDO
MKGFAHILMLFSSSMFISYLMLRRIFDAKENML